MIRFFSQLSSMSIQRAHKWPLLRKQARKEGEEDVVGKLEKVLSIAMEEKQKTLRPEIQLLNRLLGAKTGAERTAVRHTVPCARSTS